MPHVLERLDDPHPPISWRLEHGAVLDRPARLLPKQLVENLHEADAGSYWSGEHVSFHTEPIAATVEVTDGDLKVTHRRPKCLQLIGRQRERPREGWHGYDRMHWLRLDARAFWSVWLSSFRGLSTSASGTPAVDNRADSLGSTCTLRSPVLQQNQAHRVPVARVTSLHRWSRMREEKVSAASACIPGSTCW